MDGTGEFFGEGGVDEPLPSDASQSVKFFRNYQNTKMRIASAGRSGMAGVKMGFIFHVEPRWLKTVI